MKKIKVMNFGSINIDHVYKVHDFVAPGQTINCLDYEIHPGGKGLNQSIALARAKLDTYHFGKISPSDNWLQELLVVNGVNPKFLELSGSVTGHAIIQVNQHGENCIVIHGGANRELQLEQIQNSLKQIKPDACLVQNETNLVPDIIREANKNKIPVYFNPAPYTAEIEKFPLETLESLILNETEAFEFCKTDSITEALQILSQKFPELKIVLTLGKRGAIYKYKEQLIEQTGFAVEAVDTTAAGDTFIGFYMAEFLDSKNPAMALKIACQAAALSVTKKGAAASVPTLLEVQNFFK
jgi:ribokinase